MRIVRWHYGRGCIAALILTLSACAVQWVSSYDPVTDQAISQLHRNTETFLSALENQSIPDCLSINHRDFYQKMFVDIRALHVRAQSIPQNELTLQQISLLQDSLGLLQQTHVLQDKSAKCMSPGLIATNRASFESIYVAMMKFELAKKRQTSKE
jgi:hypothetical protein